MCLLFLCQFQVERVPPPVPERVVYFNLKEICTDVAKHSPPWIVLRHDAVEDCLALGFIDENSDVAVKVTFKKSFHPSITRHGMVIFTYFSSINSGTSQKKLSSDYMGIIRNCNFVL